MNMHSPRSLGKGDNATKRGLAEEHLEVPSKAAKLGNGTNTKLKSQELMRRLEAEYPLPLHKVLAQQQDALQSFRSNEVPGPVYYAKMKANGKSPVPLPPPPPPPPPPSNNNSGPVPSRLSARVPNGVHNVQSGPIARPSQSDSQQSGPQQSEPQQSSLQYSGPYHSGPPQSGPHQHNVSYAYGPGGMNGFQGLNHGNAVQSENPVYQSGYNPQLAGQTDPLPPQPASPYPLSIDTRRITYVSRCIAELGNGKVLELLASAAMYHADVLLAVEVALSQQRGAEIQNSSRLVEHLVAQCVHGYNTMRMGPPAQTNQYPQPQYFQPQHPPAQHPPEDYSQVQYLAPQYSQPDRDTREKDEDDEGEESSESSESSEDVGFSSFEASASRVDYILGTKYAGLRDSQQTHIIYEAYSSIEKEVQHIADAVRPSDSYDTKHRAMRALHKIGMMMVEPVGFLENKVVGYVGYSDVFVEAFQSLYDSMTGTERERMSRDNLENLEQLDKKRKGYFEGFDNIVKQFRRRNYDEN